MWPVADFVELTLSATRARRTRPDRARLVRVVERRGRAVRVDVLTSGGEPASASARRIDALQPLVVRRCPVRWYASPVAA
jgi:hypothetical protein